jgi:hypothetical protein
LGAARQRRGRFSFFITAVRQRRVSFFLLPSRRGSGHFSTAMDISGVETVTEAQTHYFRFDSFLAIF